MTKPQRIGVYSEKTTLTKSVNIPMPKPMWLALRRKLADDKMSMSHVVRELIKQYLSNMATIPAEERKCDES